MSSESTAGDRLQAVRPRRRKRRTSRFWVNPHLVYSYFLHPDYLHPALFIFWMDHTTSSVHCKIHFTPIYCFRTAHHNVSIRQVNYLLNLARGLGPRPRLRGLHRRWSKPMSTDTLLIPTITKDPVARFVALLVIIQCDHFTCRRIRSVRYNRSGPLWGWRHRWSPTATGAFRVLYLVQHTPEVIIHVHTPETLALAVCFVFPRRRRLRAPRQTGGEWWKGDSGRGLTDKVR